MKKMIALFAMVILSGTAFGQFDPATANLYPYIEVNGYAKEEVTPDRIFIQFQIEEKDSRGKNSIDEQQNRMIQALRNIGVDVEKQLTINDMSSTLQKYLIRRNDIRLSRNYVLEVNSASAAVAAFAALEAAGVASGSIDRSEYRDIETLKTQVKVLATQNAQQKARELAGAIGQTIGKAIYIQDMERTYRPYTANMMVRSASTDMAESAAGSPVIDFEKITVESNITVRFILE